MGRSFKSIPVIAACMLTVIFAVLCLTVFAMLTLSTQKADQRLSDASAQAVKNYYAADSKAEKVLSDIRNGITDESVTEKNGVYSYACQIDDTQSLEVEISKNGDKYEILKWQAVSTTQWNADQTLNVYKGK